MCPSLFQVLNISQMAMQSQLQDLDVTSSNISNVNTTGYKANRANFQELLQAGNPEGVTTRSTQVLLNQGSIISSDSPLNLAIQGEGFFAVNLGNGQQAYTRDGTFTLDQNHQIVTSGGQRLVWNGQIPADAEDVAVSDTGVVSTRKGEVWTQAGTIQTYRFANPTALQMQGENLFLATPISGAAQAGTPGSGRYGVIAPSSLEASNVNIGSEMTHMITIQRAFQVSTRAFQQTDQMISLAINMRKG